MEIYWGKLVDVEVLTCIWTKTAVMCPVVAIWESVVDGRVERNDRLGDSVMKLFAERGVEPYTLDSFFTIFFFLMMQLLLLVILFGGGAFSLTAQQQPITIKHSPTAVLIENVGGQNVVNFDFLIENTSQDTLELSSVKISLFDAKRALLQERFLDNNGTAPSIKTIPNRVWNGKSKELVFNPFPAYSASLQVRTMAFEFTFGDNNDKEYTVKYEVTPARYEQKVQLILPLQERLLVYDAHDFNAHHRRFNYEFVPIKQLGFSGNFMRYAYDFVVVNDGGLQKKNDGKENTDWFGFGAPVLAVAAGKVVVAEGSHLDDKKFNIPALKTNPLALYGNCVVIEHSAGVYSVYGHLKQNSISVKVGDVVKQAQTIGAIGTSGSSFFPHLHFEMRNAITHNAEGIPSYFSNFSFLRGAEKQVVKYGTVDSGDIVKSGK